MNKNHNSLGQRIEFHCHSIFSDGCLLPNAIVREVEIKGGKAVAITDHVDASNLEFCVKSLVNFAKEMKDRLSIAVIPGAEISYLPPDMIADYCKKARDLGAKLIVVHGESPVEPVPPGTNHTVVQLKGLVDILAHPGNITEEDAYLAKQNNIFLEISARKGHKLGNKHVARMAKKTGAKLLVDTDAHSEKDLITQEQALKIAMQAGLKKEEAIRVIKDNAEELLYRILQN